MQQFRRTRLGLNFLHYHFTLAVFLSDYLIGVHFVPVIFTIPIHLDLQWPEMLEILNCFQTPQLFSIQIVYASCILSLAQSYIRINTLAY